jgi:hypothetical protein
MWPLTQRVVRTCLPEFFESLVVVLVKSAAEKKHLTLALLNLGAWRLLQVALSFAALNFW